MRLQRNSHQLHQIRTHKCGHLTISQVILTINQYTFYHDIHHKNTHNVRILAAETDFLNVELPKRNNDHCVCKIDSMV